MKDSSEIRVLLVDDEQTLLKFLSKRLLRDGFTVKITFCGEEAVQAASDRIYDVAVVDINMPGIDGLETLKMLTEIQPDMQCVILTGLQNPEDLPQGTEKNAYRLMFKPVDFESLTQTIREAHRHKLKLQKEKNPREGSHAQDTSQDSRIKKIFSKMQKLYGIPDE
jgi:two-component system NtrC family response regulator